MVSCGSFDRQSLAYICDQVLPVARAASIQREMHMRDSHPYAPFPVARLEAAVAAVPPEAYEPAERSLTAFGRAHRFR